MKLIIAGSRSIKWKVQKLDFVIQGLEIPVTEVVCGLAKGIDLSGRDWANTMGVPWVAFAADWDTYGIAAGPKRNRQMAEHGDMLLLIWDGVVHPDGKGKGSKSMLTEARKAGIKIVQIILEDV